MLYGFGYRLVSREVTTILLPFFLGRALRSVGKVLVTHQLCSEAAILNVPAPIVGAVWWEEEANVPRAPCEHRQQVGGHRVRAQADREHSRQEAPRHPQQVVADAHMAARGGRDATGALSSCLLEEHLLKAGMAVGRSSSIQRGGGTRRDRIGQGRGRPRQSRAATAWAPRCEGRPRRSLVALAARSR